MITITISGYLGRDAEVKQTSNQQFAKFSVGSSQKVKGEKKTTWVDCTLWGDRGSKLAQYLTKGTKVCVTGTGDLYAYKTRDGVDKVSLCCRVSEIDLMGGGERQERPAPAKAESDDYELDESPPNF